MSPILIFLLTMVPATVLLGGHDVINKRLLQKRIDEQLLLGFTWTLVGALSLLGLLFVGIPAIAPGFWSALAVTAILNIIAQFAWYRAFRLENVSLVAPLRILVPVLVIGSGFIFLGERPSLAGIGGIMVIVLGLWYLMVADAGVTQRTLKQLIKSPGVLWALVGVVAFGISFTFDKKAVISSSAFLFVAINFTLIGLVSLAIARWWRGKRGITAFVRKAPALCLINVIVFAVAGWLSNYSLNFALAAYASSVKRLEALFAVIFSGTFLQEKNIFKKVLATVIMLAGIAITIVFG